MLLEINQVTIRQAKSPHEVFMINLAVFHLLAAPAAIVLDLGMPGLLVPLSLSLLVIAFIWIRTITAQQKDHWFVSAHWRLAAYRTKILLIGYTISGLTIGLALLATAGSSKGDIMLVALTRVAIVPTLITVMICFVLESGSIYQVSRGEVPDSLVKKFPPPDEFMDSGNP